MIEIVYRISEEAVSMFVEAGHTFCLAENKWQAAETISVGDCIVSRNGDIAEVIELNMMAAECVSPSLKSSHNHHYFLVADAEMNEAINSGVRCGSVPVKPLELIPYNLANRPSSHANGEPTGNHAGPWAAAEYLNTDMATDVIAWGCASDTMCAEDAAVSALRLQLGNKVSLSKVNVKISHAYIRKYTKKGRMINIMSPCLYCRKNYGEALSDATVGESDLDKAGRGHLPNK